MTSRFTAWSKKAVTSPTIWTTPKATIRVTVRLIHGFAGQHTVKIEPGDRHASTGLNRTSITFPDPLDDTGPTTACRTFITQAIRDAIQRDRHMRWIEWPDGTTTAFTPDDLTPVLLPPTVASVDRRAKGTPSGAASATMTERLPRGMSSVEIAAESNMQDRDPNIVNSGLSQTVTRQGASVEVMIYRLEHDPKWALEVVNEAGTSTVWDNLFDTDEEALEAFDLTLREEGIDAFLDRSNVIEFPARR